MKIAPFAQLNKIFSKNGYKLYAVGGTVRDFLLNREVSDWDFVTDATPEQMRAFLLAPLAKYTFAKYGVIKYRIDENEVDIVTLREEFQYRDSRHPQKINFIHDLSKDSDRRDFTINALYMDFEGAIYDFHNGQQDLHNHLLRCIGEASLRLKEDPLRLLRACRFAATLDLKLDADLKESIIGHKEQLRNLNKIKIFEEMDKCPLEKREKMFSLFKELGIEHIIDELK